MIEWMLLARRNEAANKWLEDNPMVLGCIALGIGGLLLYFGVTGLLNGTAKDKYGNEMSGGLATVISVVRTAIGVGAVGFGIYVMLFGAP